MKALEILKHYTGSISPITYTPSIVSQAIKELEDLDNRSCENCKYSRETYWTWETGRPPENMELYCEILDKSEQSTPYSDYKENRFYCRKGFYCNKWSSK